MLTRRKLAVLAFTSGFSSLGSETLFFKLLDYSVGSAPLVSLTVVAAFILGIGVGSLLSARVRRPWIAEALLSAYNAAWLVAFDTILAINGAILAALAPAVGPNAACVLLALAYVGPPAVLLGITLPAVIEKSSALDAEPAGLSRPYRVQALGAAAGVLLVEAVLFPFSGMPGCLSALVITHAVSAVLLSDVEVPFAPSPIGRPPTALIAAGIGTGAFQGLWLFLAILLYEPFYYVQPIVVALMLIGIFAGAWLFSLARSFDFQRTLAAVVGGIGVSAVVASLLMRRPQEGTLLEPLLELPLSILPAAIPIGAVLPAYFRDRSPDRSLAGGGLLAISIGNALGVLGVGALATPHLSPFLCFLPIAGLLAALWIAGALRARFDRIATLAAAGGAVAAIAASASIRDVDFVRRLPDYDFRTITLERVLRGPAELTGIFSFPWSAGGTKRRLYQNGYSPIELDRGAESMIAVVGAAYSRDARRALVLGAGSGRSAGAAALVFEQTDVVDIGSTVKDLLALLRDENFDLLSRAGVRFHSFDAVLAPWALEPGYDLIVQTVDPAMHAQAAKLYTVEYLVALRRLLRPDGVFVFWSDSNLDAEANQILINSGRAVFQHQKLFSADPLRAQQPLLSYYFLVHSDQPLEYRPDRHGLFDRFHDDRAARQLPRDSDAGRLLPGRVHETEDLHRLWRPARTILRGGSHAGPIALGGAGPGASGTP